MIEIMSGDYEIVLKNPLTMKKGYDWQPQRPKTAEELQDRFQEETGREFDLEFYVVWLEKQILK